MAKANRKSKIKLYDPLNPQSQKFTEAQAMEFKKCAEDFTYFATTYIKIQTSDRGTSSFGMRLYQMRMATKIVENRYTIFDAPRQCGKTTAVSAVILWLTIFQNDYRIGIGANKLRSAKEIMRRLKFAYEEMPMWMKPAVKEYNKQTIEFDNNSSIEADSTTADGLRSKTFNLIYLDEFAHIKPIVVEEFWASTFPVVSAGKDTKVVITSTPNGTEGVYASLWFGAVNDDNGFVYDKIEAHEIEGRDEAFKQAMLKKMTLTKYLQEFEGAFLSSKGTLISSMFLESIRRSKPIELFRDTLFYVDPANRRLVIGADIGTGVGADFHTIQIFDLDTLEQVGEFRNNTYNQTQFAREYIYLLNYLDTVKKCKQVYYSLEANSWGIGVMNLLLNSNHPVFSKTYVIQVNQYGQKLPGMTTTPTTKRKGCAKFKDLIENSIMTLHSERLITELQYFVKHGDSFKAEAGKNDDLVMGCVIVSNMLEEISQIDTGIYEKMNQLDVLQGDLDDAVDEPMPIVI